MLSVHGWHLPWQLLPAPDLSGYPFQRSRWLRLHGCVFPERNSLPLHRYGRGRDRDDHGHDRDRGSRSRSHRHGRDDGDDARARVPRTRTPHHGDDGARARGHDHGDDDVHARDRDHDGDDVHARAHDHGRDDDARVRALRGSSILPFLRSLYAHVHS